MFTLKIENRQGEILTLTHNQNYIVKEIDGLEPPKAGINLSDVSGMAGGLYNSSKVEPRNLVLTVLPCCPVDDNRLHLYRFAQAGQWCKIYYANKSLNVKIEGYVETIEAQTFTKLQQIQISIICPQPYFVGMKEIYNDISDVIADFEFPFSIPQKGVEFSYLNPDMLAHVTNYGDVDTGVVINIATRGEVVNPTIHANNTRGAMGVNVTLHEHDQLIIDTNSGQRNIFLIRDNTETSIINRMKPNPEWFVLTPGENVFSYTAESGADLMSVTFEHQTKYGGV